MRTVFLALATSAAIFATGLTPAGAQNYPYCIQGDDFAGGAGECSFSKLRAVPGNRFRTDSSLRTQSLLSRQRPAHLDKSRPRHRSH